MAQAAPQRSPLLSLLFGFSPRVDRRTYIVCGVVLMLVKYLLDATVAWTFAGAWWSPLRYLWPLWSVRMAQFQAAPSALFLCLGLMMLPFFWIGISMSVRRAADAGLAAFLGLGFAVPGVNFLVMIVLSLAESSSRRGRTPGRCEMTRCRSCAAPSPRSWLPHCSA